MTHMVWNTYVQAYVVFIYAVIMASRCKVRLFFSFGYVSFLGRKYSQLVQSPKFPNPVGL